MAYLTASFQYIDGEIHFFEVWSDRIRGDGSNGKRGDTGRKEGR